jgi:hypothetical protein
MFTIFYFGKFEENLVHGISVFLDFIHHPVFQGTHSVSETGSVSILR